MGTPFYRETVLPNGLRVATKNFPGTRTFSLAIVVRRGSRHDPPRLAGLAHFLEHLVHKGTKRWKDSDRISAQFESKGLEENALTSRSYTSFYIYEAMPRLLEYCFDFLTEIVVNPLLEEEAISPEKGVIVDEHFTYKDRSEIEIEELLSRMLYLHSPLGRRIEGSPETIGRIQRSDLVRMHQKYYVPNNMIVVAVGNIQHRTIVKLARHYLGHLPSQFVAISPARNSRLSNQHRRRICRPALNVAYVNVGTKFTNLTPKEMAVLEILGNVLSGSTLSRLYKLIRTKLGKVYSINSLVNDLGDSQELVIDTAPLHQDLEQIINLTLSELKKLKETSISAKELKLAKTIIAASYYRGNEYSGGFFDEFITSLVQGTIKNSFAGAIPIIRSITLADVRAFLDQHFDLERFRIAIIAPKK